MTNDLLRNNSTDADERATADDDGQELLNCFILSDDAASAVSAESLLGRVSGATPCRLQHCGFGELNSTARLHATAVAAGRAEILIVAVRENEKLPLAVCEWLYRWLAQRDKQHDGALVAMVTSESAGAYIDPELTFFLESLASIGGLAFFAGRVREPSQAQVLPVGDEAATGPIHSVEVRSGQEFNTGLPVHAPFCQP